MVNSDLAEAGGMTKVSRARNPKFEYNRWIGIRNDMTILDRFLQNRRKRFQPGLNNLFVLERSATRHLS